MTYRLRSPIVMRGATLSLLGSARRDCGFASAPATRKSCGNPPLGGFSVTVSPSRCKTARCAGPFARRILLSEPEPTLLSPGCSHSSPTSESQPSGFKSSAACWVRQAARSLSKLPVWARSAAARKSPVRSEEHTSELQSHSDLVCRLLLEKKNKKDTNLYSSIIPLE